MKSLLFPSLLAALAAGLTAAASGAGPSALHYAPLKYQPICSHGQALVDMEMAKHRELKLITLHATPPGVPADANEQRCILCSSIGRFGKPDAGPDADVFKKNQEFIELTKTAPPGTNPGGPTAPPKYEVLTPLLDRSGASIGIAVIVFLYKEGDDLAKLHQIAMDIRDELRQRIASKDDLLRPAS